MNNYTKFTIILVCSIVICSKFSHGKEANLLDWIESVTGLSLLQKDNDQITITIDSAEIYEKCLSLKNKQRVDYSFKANQPISFNIHYHSGEQIKYPVSERVIASFSTMFNPKLTQTYCFMWENNSNISANLDFEFHIRMDLKAQDNRIPVYFRIDKDKRNISIVDQSGTNLGEVKVGDLIHNFSFDPKHKYLVVLTSNDAKAVQIYALATLRLKKIIVIDQAPRFLAFSKEGKFLALANEHSDVINFIDMKHFNPVGSLSIPFKPIALSASDVENQLLIRTEKEILNVQFNPIKLLKRREKIPIKFGDETLLIDPTEWCFTHGIPHPLYSPPLEFMNKKGLLVTLPLANKQLNLRDR
ncbi:MAG: hypothetical protein HQM14_11455 [SAR324 cluster bacterium]|nr:hypothetical protein [SAR324 cluster bacterium]